MNENELADKFGLEPSLDDLRAFGFKLAAHKDAVRKNAEALKKEFPFCTSLDSFFDYCIVNHDASKYVEPEYSAYSLKYAMETKKFSADAEKTIMKFYREALLHHFMGNGHHPEHWRLKYGNINAMPEVYVAEFCCDVASFQRQWPETHSVFDWWGKSKKKKFSDFDEAHVKKIEQFLKVIARDIEIRSSIQI